MTNTSFSTQRSEAGRDGLAPTDVVDFFFFRNLFLSSEDDEDELELELELELEVLFIFCRERLLFSFSSDELLDDGVFLALFPPDFLAGNGGSGFDFLSTSDPACFILKSYNVRI